MRPTFALFVLLATVAPSLAVWPLPSEYSTGSTALRLSPSFAIKFASNLNNAPADLLAAVTRTSTYLRTDQLEALVPDRGASYASAVDKAKTLSSLTLSLTSSAPIKSISEEAVVDLESRIALEGYTLSIPSDGSGATLTANSTLGLFRGLTTFGQLWYDLDGTTYTVEAPFSISDAPAYPYRGFMLDTARNYFPVSDILRTLDAMSWVKINTFHWHITDAQSFPLVVPGYPTLSEEGAYSASQVYTAEDVATIVAYAAARGIDVMPEIDTPGHTSIIAHAYPQHIACFQATPWSEFANEPPAGQLRFANNETTQFTADLLKNVASLFQSQLFSTGGDELNTNCYAQDNATQADLAASGQTLEEALNTFTQATHDVLIQNGKRPVVWEEMVLSHNVTLANDTIALVWISSDDVAAVAEKGFKLIHAASDYFYLDCGHGGWVGDYPAGNS
ncbi:hypothetical protein H0H92_009866, partial [Tricholoma furcatifolium]